MKVTVLKALTNYFNVVGDTGSLGGEWTPVKGGAPVELPYGRSAKRGMTDWRDELVALGDDGKRELAEMVCAVTGDTLS